MAPFYSCGDSCSGLDGISTNRKLREHAQPFDFPKQSSITERKVIPVTRKSRRKMQKILMFLFILCFATEVHTFSQMYSYSDAYYLKATHIMQLRGCCVPSLKLVRRKNALRSRRFPLFALSSSFDPGETSQEIFHELAKRLLEDSGGQLDSMAFGRKWRLAYPDRDLDAFRFQNRACGMPEAAFAAHSPLLQERGQDCRPAACRVSQLRRHGPSRLHDEALRPRSLARARRPRPH